MVTLPLTGISKSRTMAQARSPFSGRIRLSFGCTGQAGRACGSRGPCALCASRRSFQPQRPALKQEDEKTQAPVSNSHGFLQNVGVLKVHSSTWLHTAINVFHWFELIFRTSICEGSRARISHPGNPPSTLCHSCRLPSCEPMRKIPSWPAQSRLSTLWPGSAWNSVLNSKDGSLRVRTKPATTQPKRLELKRSIG